MKPQWQTPVARIFLMSVVALVGVGVAPLGAMAQSFIPATRAFEAPACSASDLSNDTDFARVNPEWKPILFDPANPSHNLPTILEGRITTPLFPSLQQTSATAPTEVAEEDIPWTHYTHDFTFKVVPDSAYQHLLSSWVNTDGTVGVHTDMEVEWENAALMDEKEGFQRIWGAVPEF